MATLHHLFFILSKKVGEAVADELPKYNTKLTVLGIATWGGVKDRELLVNKLDVNFH